MNEENLSESRTFPVDIKFWLIGFIGALLALDLTAFVEGDVYMPADDEYHISMVEYWQGGLFWEDLHDFVAKFPRAQTPSAP